jgi:ABC-type branched-subunit amino acid transport system ATPase component/branched-subunit amino acid ABC-type transport system permease component
MSSLLPFIVVGLTSGSVYALIGLGLVLTYKTSGIFNLAHGALATASAYVFYALHFQHHVAWPVAAFVAVVAVGAAFGLAWERIAAGLQQASLAYRIVATVGVLLIIEAVCDLGFGTTPLTVGTFLPGGHVTAYGAVVGYDRLIIVALALIAAVGLYVFFRWARLGKAMRAVVDNPALLDLSGTNPVRVRRAAWVIGCLFATLSGPLLVETLGSLDAETLSALVIVAFAAAALGSFSNLPLTYAGGLLIGIATSVAQKYISGGPGSIISGLPEAVPFIILFVLMLVMPRSRLALRSLIPRRPEVRWSAPPRVRAVALLAMTVFLAAVPAWAGYHVGDWTAMLTYIVLFLSLGLLVRTSGQVSLAQVTFAAIGVVAFSKLTQDTGLPWLPALIISGLIAVPVGAVLAIPAIRLSGIFLALATMGFGLLVKDMFYQSNLMFGQSLGGLGVPLPDVSWLSSTTGFYYLVLIITVICAAVVAGVSRTRLGRLLQAMSDSSLALQTSGSDVNTARVLVFCISAYLAAIAGALYGAYTSVVTAGGFDPSISLTLLTIIVIVAGSEPWYAIIAAAGFILIPAYWHPYGITYYMQIVFGVSALAVALSPPKGPVRLRALIDRLGGKPGERPVVGDRPARDRLERRTVEQKELAVRGLTVRFGGATAVGQLDLVARSGQITGLIGPNGAGKTTTFNACSGLIRPTEGRISLNGTVVSGKGPAQRARLGLGRTFQHVELWDSLTVFQNVALAAEAGLSGANVVRQVVGKRGDRNYITSRAEDALRQCGLTEDADTLTASLPIGKRRLVETARCISGNFSLVLMDEPSSGLDQYETERFGAILRGIVDERGVGIVLVEHDMRLVMQVCDYIYVLDFGQKIFEGTPEQVRNSPVVRDAYLGSEDLGSEDLGTGEAVQR